MAQSAASTWAIELQAEIDGCSCGNGSKSARPSSRPARAAVQLQRRMQSRTATAPAVAGRQRGLSHGTKGITEHGPIPISPGDRAQAPRGGSRRAARPAGRSLPGREKTARRRDWSTGTGRPETASADKRPAAKWTSIACWPQAGSKRSCGPKSGVIQQHENALAVEIERRRRRWSRPIARSACLEKLRRNTTASGIGRRRPRAGETAR